MVINNIKIVVCFDIIITNYLSSEKRYLVEAIPKMMFRFEKSQDIKELPQYYLYAFDLMQFISFRQNVSFDEITLSRTILDGDKKEKIKLVQRYILDLCLIV